MAHAACFTFSALSIDSSDVREPHRRAVAERHDDRAVTLAGKQLVVGADGVGLVFTLKSSLGLVDIRVCQRRAQILQAKSIGSQCRGIRLHPHGRPLTTTYADQADAGKLGDFLCQCGVRQIFHLYQRQSGRSDRQRQNRGIGGIDLAVNRGVGKPLGQQVGGGIDFRLHFLLRHINAQVQIELQGDYGAPERTGRGHLEQAGNLTEVALQRSGDRGAHHFRAGSRIKCLDLNSGVVHLRECGHWQLAIGHQSHQNHTHHQQRGCNGPQDKRPRGVHRAGPPVGEAKGELAEEAEFLLPFAGLAFPCRG